MTDKVHLLTQICETPGWQPPEQASSIERSLHELLTEGWIAPRLDGWEATHRALECYPNFYLDDDGRTMGERTVSASGAQSASGDTVPVERLVMVVRALLEVMPIAAVDRLLQLDLPEGDLAWRIARELTDTLLRTDSRVMPSVSLTS